LDLMSEIGLPTEKRASLNTKPSTNGDGSALSDLVDRLLGQERLRPFDLERGPVLHTALLPVSTDRHLLALSLPALCADTQSLDNLHKELALYYKIALRGAEPDDEVAQYLQFSEWQNEVLVDEGARVGWRYWQQTMANLPELRLPFARSITGTTDRY